MDIQDYANLGSAVMTGDPSYVGAIEKDALHARNHSNDLRRLLAYALPTEENLRTRIDGPIVGWTTPSLTYDKQRQINGSALSLNFDIEKNVKRPEFKASWNQWFQTWQTFFARYQTDSGKAGALLDTDAVAAQTESFRLQLVGDPTAPSGSPARLGWMGAYEAEGVGPTSAHAVPKIDPAPPGGDLSWWERLTGKTKDPEAPSEGVPWWLVSLFVVGGVGFVAGSFFIIRRKVIEGKQTEKFIRHDVLPIVLGSTMGPTGVAFAHAANARFANPSNDPSGMGGPTRI